MTAPETIEGWFALHDVRRLDPQRWSDVSPGARQAMLEQAAVWLRQAREATAGGKEGLTAAFELVGHKGDLLFLHLRPTIDGLRDLERGFDALDLAGCCQRPFSFLSVTEMSLYGGAESLGDDPLAQPRVRRRVFPSLPDFRYICFYPMDRKRAGDDNWYTLDFETRQRLVREHGMTGRQYAGRVTQIITGSVGLDDWEWGVTLFSDDPLQFKKLVYEMRFDEASARFARFGPFFVGPRLEPEDLPARFQ